MTWERLRLQVLERDNYTCQQCFQKNEKLEAHHIIPRNHGGLSSINNLITVCRKCHTFIEPLYKQPNNLVNPIKISGIRARVSRMKDKFVIIVPKRYHKDIERANIVGEFVDIRVISR